MAVDFAVQKLLRLPIILLLRLPICDCIDTCVLIMVSSEPRPFHVNIAAKQIIQVVSLLHEWHELARHEIKLAATVLLCSGARCIILRGISDGVLRAAANAARAR